MQAVNYPKLNYGINARIIEIAKGTKLIRPSPYFYFSYELDFNKPKTWSWFETFYDETNHLQEDPRSGRYELFLNLRHFSYHVSI